MTGVLGQLANLIDPDAAPDHPELATPVTLATYLDPHYQVRAHLELIGEELAELERGTRFDRLMVNTPPRVGKTRVIEWFVFWWLIKHPTHRVIIGSYGDDLAMRAGGHIRTLIERYGADYGLVLQHGSAAKKDWELTTGGGVRSVGIGSGITGHDGDLIIVDDPTKSRAEAESVAHRDRIYDWWSGDLSTRVVPDTRMVMIQTPWHPDDLRVRVLKAEGDVDAPGGGRWRVVIMPALCEDPATDPLHRGYGEPLPHPKIAAHDNVRLLTFWERQRSAIAVRDWRALFQCDPKAPEGQLVTAGLLRERRCYEVRDCGQPGRAGVAVDPSGGGRDVAGIIGGHLDDRERCVFTHDRSLTGPADAWGRAACELAEQIGAEFIVFEDNYGADMARVVIRTAWDALRRENPGRYQFVPLIKSVHARKGKLLRAEPIGQQWSEGRCQTGAYLPDFESEWSTWTPGGESPGRIDAGTYLAYELLPLAPAGEPDGGAMASMLAGADLLSGLGRFGR